MGTAIVLNYDVNNVGYLLPSIAESQSLPKWYT